MAGEVHLNDIGTIFRLTIKDQDGAVVDVSSATGAGQKEILFEGPGKLMTKTAVFLTDGTDGVIQYVNVSGDHSVVGQWKMQGHVILTSGQWSTAAVAFPVLNIIN